LAETVAAEAYGHGMLLRIDLSEYARPHEVARLIGAPPGYVGHDRDGVLTGWLRRHPHSVVLFDEADKADGGVFDVLLQLIDAGRITDGQGTTVDGSQALFLLTANDAARHEGARAMGFVPPEAQGASDGAARAARDADGVRGRFRPEFLGRLDGVLSMS